MAAITTTSSPSGYFIRSGVAQADTGQVDYLLVPAWANYAWVMVNVIATAGTTPLLTPLFSVPDPIALDDTRVIKLAEHTGFTDNDGTAAQYVYELGPGVTGIADDVTQAAGADSYVSLNVILPPILGVRITLDRTTGNETYTYNLAVYFRP